MSWDAYVDTTLGYCLGHADKCAIIGQDGSHWTGAGKTEKDFGNAFTTAESQALARGIMAYHANGDKTQFETQGVVIDGVKYMFLRFAEGQCLAKKKDNGALTIQKSNKAIVIAHVQEGKQQGDVNNGVKKIIEYLEGVGY